MNDSSMKRGKASQSAQRESKEPDQIVERENPYESGHALELFEKRIAQEEYKAHALPQKEYLPNEARMIAENDMEQKVDQIKSDLFVADN